MEKLRGVVLRGATGSTSSRPTTAPVALLGDGPLHNSVSELPAKG